MDKENARSRPFKMALAAVLYKLRIAGLNNDEPSIRAALNRKYEIRPHRYLANPKKRTSGPKRKPHKVLKRKKK